MGHLMGWLSSCVDTSWEHLGGFSWKQSPWKYREPPLASCEWRAPLGTWKGQASEGSVGMWVLHGRDYLRLPALLP